MTIKHFLSCFILLSSFIIYSFLVGIADAFIIQSSTRILPSTSTPNSSTLYSTKNDQPSKINGSTKENDPKFQQRSKSWIVLVDDEESIRLAVGKYLYESGYTVTACADAEALLELLTSASTGRLEDEMPTKLPSVIICDIRMPGGLDGMELLDILKNPDSASVKVSDASSDLAFVRSTWRRIPVILLTAKSLTQDRILGYRKGADVYLPKPFAPEELLSIVDNLISRTSALSGASSKSGSTLREIKSEIIDIKGILKSSKLQANRKNGTKKSIKRLEQENASAIVPRKRDERFGYEKEMEAITSQIELSDLEKDVLELLSDGNTNGEIAKTLDITIAKVGRVISKLYSKTFTKTRTELVRWALKMGII
ncbi:diatom response regulator 1 [Chaetoceros tenuissimus]|uniref:Diatom response regulator 1 n=1 Tax=Chaetoceros tenuissimus TaxID=426638 RepID=A0AAD3CTV3_9STRA|nr:diatom response regulator 1 [Chaetoceros tenuissimus]